VQAAEATAGAQIKKEACGAEEHKKPLTFKHLLDDCRAHRHVPFHLESLLVRRQQLNFALEKENSPQRSAQLHGHHSNPAELRAANTRHAKRAASCPYVQVLSYFSAPFEDGCAQNPAGGAQHARQPTPWLACLNVS